jgi:arginine repressor
MLQGCCRRGKKVEQVAHGEARMARLKQLVGQRQIQRQRQIPRLLAVAGIIDSFQVTSSTRA